MNPSDGNTPPTARPTRRQGPAPARPARSAPRQGPGAAGVLVRTLRPLVVAEASAEAHGEAMDSRDLEQGVWLRLLERIDVQGPPDDAAGWVQGAVREEARQARRTALRERSHQERAVIVSVPCPERTALLAERRRAVRAAVARTPGACPRLLTAMLSPNDPTYREIAGQLGISQGSLGPMRSRCLGCLRRMLATEVAAPELRGKER
ncbi:sigma-70 family RNA polymerase sigma factor [Streptomyces sp. NPDC059176]|uniref:sigma-70 family RNA polymerase sigma factor n=1 Tax=unclassified Streptomyces TaxID=2593676 RepID=UPI0036ABA11A